MKKILFISLLILVFILEFQQGARTQTSSQGVVHASGLIDETELRAASSKAIKLVQHSQVTWFKKQVCTSCHHQLLPEIMLNLARERGVPVEEPVARDTTVAAFSYLKDLDSAVQGYDYIDVFFDGWALTAARVAGVTPSLSTAAYARFIASRQLPDGSWLTMDSRPPQAHSTFAATAVCAQAIRHYLPSGLKDERESRTRMAREWLLKSQPRTTEDRAFQLLGLLWTGADENARNKAARQILSEQREDGGWAQLPAMASDSYATGQTLFALREGAGLPTGDPAYQRGLRFLLKSQEPDGSWRVKSRLHPPAPLSPPYVDTEFPYQHDQFISIMGTSWAVAALEHALPAQAGGKVKQPAPLDFAPAEQAEWIRVALTGSASELERLLQGGMKPDARTAEGTTALMFAARDLDKVKLLLARGADVNARSAAGITPLMVAARHRGNAEVVRLLLKSGARPNADKGVEVRNEASHQEEHGLLELIPADKGVEVRNEASALFFAVMAGDVQTARALLDAGARLDQQMKVLGQFLIRPLAYATIQGDTAMVEYLIGKGANPNDVDGDGISALGWASLTNHAETVRALLARGAQVNHVDKLGMTPLLYAASVDFGDTAVLEKLLAAGADLKAGNKQGMTALDLAKSYNHGRAVRLLSGRIASR